MGSVFRSGRRQTLLPRERLFAALAFGFALLLHHRLLFVGTPTVMEPEARVLHRWDEGTVNYDAARIADGQVMYRDFFQFQGPVHYYLYAGLFSLFGRSYTLARLLTATIVSLSAACLALIVSRLFGRGWRGEAAGLGAAGIHATVFVSTYAASYPHWTADLLLLAALVAVTTEDPQPGHWRSAGALAALSALTVLSLGLPALMALLGSLALPWPNLGGMKGAVVRSGWFVVGVGVAMAVVSTALLSQGAWTDMVRDSLIWPFQSYAFGQTDVVGYAAAFDRMVQFYEKLDAPWPLFGRILAETLRVPPVVAVGGFVYVFSKAGLAVFGPKSRFTSSIRFPGLALLSVSAVAAAATLPPVLQVTRADLAHLGFIGSYGLLGTVVLWVVAGVGPRIRALGAGGLAVVAVLGLITYVGNSLRNPPFTPGWIPYLARDPATRRLVPHLEVGDLLFDTTELGPLRYFYIADAAVPYTFVPPPQIARYYTEDQWSEITRALLENAPAVLHTSDGYFVDLVRREPRLARRYRKVDEDVFVLNRASRAPTEEMPEKDVHRRTLRVPVP
ncbi:MAG: hypothetical protein ACFB9M_21275 [Myxococcota bacterium]